METRAEPRCIGGAAVWRNFSNRGPQAGADGEGSSRRRELRWRSRGRRRWESRYNVQRKMRRRSAVGAGWESVHIQRSLRGMSRSEGNWGPRFCSTAPAQHPPLPRHQISPVGWPSGGDESRAEVHRGCGGVAHIQRSLRGMSRSEGNWGPRFCSTAPAQHPPLPRHQISPVGWPSGGDESRAEVHRGCGGVAELFQPRPAGRC